MSEANYTKEWYRKEIVDRKKSIPEIAAERGVTVATIRKEIRNLYTRPAWANKLIGQAAANEAEKRNLVNAPVSKKKPTKKPVVKEGAKPEKKLPYEVRLALKRGTAIVDSNYVMNHYDWCKEIENLMIPAFCIGELKSMAQYAETQKKRTEIERKVRYFEKHAEVLKADRLPELGLSEEHRDFKRRNINYARYVQYAWQVHGFKVPYLTCAYEAGVLIREYVKLEKTQA